MKVKVKVEMKPPDLMAQLRRSPARAEAVMDEMISDLAHRLAYRAKNYAPYATGNLRRSITPHRVKTGEWEVVAVGSKQKPYAAFVEFGTRPHWPPREPIERWVRIKLGIREPEAIERVAFLVSRSIAKKGTKPKRYMTRAFKETAKEVAMVAKRYASKLIGAIKGG